MLSFRAARLPRFLSSRRRCRRRKRSRIAMSAPGSFRRCSRPTIPASPMSCRCRRYRPSTPATTVPSKRGHHLGRVLQADHANVRRVGRFDLDPDHATRPAKRRRFPESRHHLQVAIRHDSRSANSSCRPASPSNGEAPVSQAVGAETFNTYVPTVWFGKGFGDLPDSLKWLRPFAVTGQVGYAIPGISTALTIDPDSGDANTQTNPQVLRWGASLQYSMPYLKSNVVDLGISDFFNRMIFIVEASMQTPIANAQDSGILSTGTINPGIIWIARYYQVGVEAVVPVNRASGADVGIIAQVHIYLDDIFPGSIGKPLFGGSGIARRMGY